MAKKRKVKNKQQFKTWLEDKGHNNVPDDADLIGTVAKMHGYDKDKVKIKKDKSAV